MKKIIVSIDAYHDNNVEDEIEKLQNKGFEVTDIKRRSKMFLGVFGRDVTEITYFERPEK